MSLKNMLILATFISTTFAFSTRDTYDTSPPSGCTPELEVYVSAGMVSAGQFSEAKEERNTDNGMRKGEVRLLKLMKEIAFMDDPKGKFKACRGNSTNIYNNEVEHQLNQFDKIKREKYSPDYLDEKILIVGMRKHGFKALDIFGLHADQAEALAKISATLLPQKTQKTNDREYSRPFAEIGQPLIQVPTKRYGYDKNSTGSSFEGGTVEVSSSFNLFDQNKLQDSKRLKNSESNIYNRYIYNEDAPDWYNNRLYNEKWSGYYKVLVSPCTRCVPHKDGYLDCVTKIDLNVAVRILEHETKEQASKEQ